MTESASFQEELNAYNTDLENIKQKNLLESLKQNPENYQKLIFGELGLPVGGELTHEGLKKLYKSTGLEAKVDKGIAGFKQRIKELVQPYQDKLGEGLETLKGYLEGGVEGLKTKATNLVNDSLTGLRDTVTGKVRDKIDQLQSQFDDLKGDLTGKYKGALGELDSLKRKGIDKASQQYKDAVSKVEGLKDELNTRVSDLQSKAEDALTSARSQIETTARSVGEGFKGKANALLSQGKGKIDAAQAKLQEVQDKIKSGATGLEDQLENAKSGVQSAIESRTSSLRDIAPEVLKSVQEGARLKLLDAQERLKQFDTDEPEYLTAQQDVTDAQSRLTSAIQDVKDRATSVSSLGRDALNARKTQALTELENAKSSLRNGALQVGDDVSTSLKGAQDKLIEAQVKYRSALLDLGENPESIIGKVSGLAEGLGDDLFGALPALGLDLASGASLSKTGEDTGVAALFNRGISVAGDLATQAKNAISGVVKRYQNLTPKTPRAGAEGEVGTEAGTVDELGGDLVGDITGEAMGTLKTLSSGFVRNRPSPGFLQNLFGDVSNPTRTLVPDEVINGVDTLGESLGNGISDLRSGLSDIKSLASSFIPRTSSLAGAGDVGTITSRGSAIADSIMNRAQSSVQNFLSSQSTHPSAPVASNTANVAKATEVAGQEQGVINNIESVTKQGADVADKALETRATAIQGKELEGGAGEAGVGDYADTASGLAEAAEGEGVGAGLEEAGEAIEGAAGDTGFGALIGGLAVLGGVFYDLFSDDSHPAPSVTDIPNYSIPTFAPSGSGR